MNTLIGILIFITITVVNIKSECGYNGCPKVDNSKLNIHVISHSHDDVGWIRTPDGYYEEEVRDIITNVVKSLEKDAKRRFTQVEVYFFNRWWNEQNEETKKIVHKLVQNGQFAFANGGWCVNDEGAAHYDSIINQMTLGLRVLNDIFGSCGRPRTSWQIDPFGASKEMASLYAMMGFDGHVTNRAINPKGEFVWRGSKDLGHKSDILTTVLHDHYSAPNGYNFEKGNDITTANEKQKADTIVNLGKTWNQNYGKTGHVLMTFGDDFQYKNAEHWFTNIDHLIKAISDTHKDVNIFYSTPMCYFQELHKLNHTFESRDNDYFPLWTGYHSSRPGLKFEDRTTNNLLQVCKQLDAIARLSNTESFINEARNEVSILQHHDAITGTSPQSTMDDYFRRLLSGYESCSKVIDKAYTKLLPKNKQKQIHHQFLCDTLNITQCFTSENNSNLAITIYNPTAHSLSQWVRIPVSSSSQYKILDPNGLKVDKTFLVPISKSVLDLHERKSNAKNEVVFKANLPALGFATYIYQEIKNMSSNSYSHSLRKKRDDSLHIMKGKGFSLELDNNSGAIKSIQMNGNTYPFKQSFKNYNSRGDSSYEFYPVGNAIDIGSVKLVSKYDNGLLHEVHQQWNDWTHQTIRVYEDEEYIEFDWIIGPIPVEKNIGKNIISRYETNINNGETFYTDSIGRQMIKRIRDPNRRERDNNITLNYYPIYSKVYIKDDKQGMQLTVLNDRTQGGSSISSGQIELMVHRRQEYDTNQIFLNELGSDGKGLVVRGKHYVFLKPINESAKYFRNLSQRLFMHPVITFSPMTFASDTEYRDNFVTLYSALNRELPENVHLLTLEQWKPNQILLRLEHFYETADDINLSKPVNVNLDNLFKSFKILNLTETTLAANEVLSQVKRFDWKTNSNAEFFDISDSHNRIKRDDNIFNVQLSPQQIRTFILDVNPIQQIDEKCSLKWVNVSGQQLPEKAILGGFDIDKKELYICRHEYKGDIVPGKSNPTKLGCVISYGGVPVEIKEGYEILVGDNIDWVPRHGGDPVPSNAFVAGKDSKANPIYVGRCIVKPENSNSETQVVGKIHHPWFYYSFGQKEYNNCDNHEVLICNN